LATVLDSFIIEFNLDPSKFTRGQRDLLDQMRRTQEESLKGATEVESHVKKTFDLLLNFKREALITFGVFFGASGIQQFVQNITNLDAATGRLSTTTGISARQLSIWQGIVQQMGGSASSANQAISAMNAELVRINQTGGQGSALLSIMARFGIDPYTSTGQLKTADQVFREFAGAAEGRDPREMAGFFRMAGINEDMINVLVKGRKALEEFERAAREAGSATDQSVKESQEFQKTMAVFGRSMENLERVISLLLIPAITDWANGLTALFKIFMRPKDEDLTPQQREERKTSDNWMRDFYNSGIFSPFHLGDRLYGKEQGTNFADRFDAIGGGAANNAENWKRFLGGLSFLETDQRNIGNATSSALGYFQFLSGTAAKATGAGIADPRFGSYEQQSAATQSYINKFYPEAAGAIAGGDFNKAISLLRGEWPSLPGGSQSQGPGRYEQFKRYLEGRDRGKQSSNTTNVHVAGVTINTTKGDADGIAREITPALKRSLQAGAANSSLV
jgi:hypothetical protein